MSKTIRWTDADWLGVAVAMALGGGAAIFRWLFIVPRASVGMCAAAAAPAVCAPRHWVLQGQFYGVFGWAALGLGLLAFFRYGRAAGPAALGLGVAAVVNYNGTQGMLGAVLGLVAWLSVVTGRTGLEPDRLRLTRAARQPRP